MKGLFKSLSPGGSTPTDDAPPSGNGKPQPSTEGRGSPAKNPRAKTTPAKSTPPKATPPASKKPSGDAGKSGAAARRKNNRKRKR